MPARWNIAATRPTNGNTAIQQFVDDELSPETLRQRAAIVLGDRDLVRNFVGMTPEDQTKFLDKIDQVGQVLPLF